MAKVREVKKITAGTVARFILLLLALINSGLQMAGIQTIPINEESVQTFISLLFLGAASLWSYWKDNDITRNARSK